MVKRLPPFQELQKVIARTFRFEPGFVLEIESVFAGLDDTEPIRDERANYLWDGKSKLAFYKAKRYSDGSTVGVEEISLQVASAPYVRCKIMLNQQAWDSLGQFRCVFSIVSQHEDRECLNDNFSAVFVASKHPSRGFEPTLTFAGKYSREHLQDLTEAGRKFTAWLNSL